MKKSDLRNIIKEEVKQILHDQLQNYEYLIHHIDITDGVEIVHHCDLYDHIGNLYIQEHIIVKDGITKIDGKKIKDGTFHFISGLEPTQEVCWGDEEAKEANISIKKMYMGMTKKEKAKEW